QTRSRHFKAVHGPESCRLTAKARRLPTAPALGPAGLADSLDTLDLRPAVRQTFFAAELEQSLGSRCAFREVGRAIGHGTRSLKVRTGSAGIAEEVQCVAGVDPHPEIVRPGSQVRRDLRPRLAAPARLPDGNAAIGLQ